MYLEALTPTEQFVIMNRGNVVEHVIECAEKKVPFVQTSTKVETY